MPRAAIDWIITDTHLYHYKMVTEWCIRPANYELTIFKNLKRLIAPQDRLIHLGDVIFHQYSTLKQWLDSFPCRKLLVLGNHDRKSRGWYMNNGFDYAVDSFVIDDILFSHKPIQRLPAGCTINIHGHFHNTDHRRHEPQYVEWYDPRIHRLLAIEYTNYEPVNLEVFLEKTKDGAIFGLET